MKGHVIVLLLVVTALAAVGVLAVYSVTAVKHNGEGLFIHHLTYLTLGLVCMLIAANVDYHLLRNRYIIMAIVAVSLALLVYVLFFGEDVRGAKRWIRIMFFQFQPSEVGKVALVIFLAAKLSENRDELWSLTRGFAPPFAIALLYAGLIVLEPDLGVPVVIMCTAFIMMFVAGVHIKYLAASTVPVVAIVALLIRIYPYRLERLFAFLDPWEYRQTAGFHLIQSLAAFARGAYTGTGLGAGEQKLLYLPDAHTDFIFAVWAEETGLVGTLSVAVLFLLFIFIAVRIAMCAPDRFGSLLATGIATLVATQALINMAVTAGLAPTKGLPLPFISCGGTAMVIFLSLTGMLINVGLQAREPERNVAHAY
ncbi:MAG: putative lipid II flippase FtsW [Nitrospiraceae bacterium]|nr:putative lipid II flippase FtsW [Nitrospiraceae bacterium]